MDFANGSDARSPDEQLELHFSDSDEEDQGPEPGIDYASRMEEILGEESEDDAPFTLDSDDEEGFVYTGVDAVQTTEQGYRERLREILGTDSEGEADADAIVPTPAPQVVVEENDEKLKPGNNSERTNSTASTPASVASSSPSARSLHAFTPQKASSSKLARPFLHPNVSRLRSHATSATQPLLGMDLLNFHSPSPSHFSSLSRMSSFSNSQRTTTSSKEIGHAVPTVKINERDVFKWTNLQTITQGIYVKNKKALSVLGSNQFDSPTVLAANGYICIGTSDGKVLVYDFLQNRKCICGAESSDRNIGAVTALALSHDHTCIAAGYSNGHIQIYNLQNPQTSIRSVPPTTLAAVYSGRKEGHIQGSRIVSIGFVAGRHTAVVSADIHGLAFYHSLGKVLFVEAPDILRILGRYPDPPPPPVHSKDHRAHNAVAQRNPRYTILAMSPLPLGTSPHVTDRYNLTAMLTPTKLVIVGLKPSPKTWFKVPRGLEEGGAWRTETRWKGTMAWFPSVFEEPNGISRGQQQQEGTVTAPTLAFSWGKALRVIRIKEVIVKQVLKNAKTGKERELEVGAIDYENVLSWIVENDILAVQWLNVKQIIILTHSQLGVYDLPSSNLIECVSFDASTLISPTISHIVNGSVTYQEPLQDVSHSIRVYKGKIFLLGRDDIRVGTLLTWADRILSLVEEGDFLGAIDLARSYYIDEALGNRNGLPTDALSRKEIIGEKLQDLMVASTRYAFSEDRLTDSTHMTPDGRGVDRTSLFENLVVTCCKACISLNDTEFLFEELFQKYDDSGISSIYLRNLEPFVLNNEIRDVPPRITQRLISLHEEDGRPDLVERVIWHIDPACLDINQAIHLCQKHHLYNALIYVYTRALRDYVAPIVEILGLIRRVLRNRRAKVENSGTDLDESFVEPSLEPLILNSYKVYPYLSHILSGLTYPSGEPLTEDEASQAKRDIYTFLFYGRSSVWPPGEGGKLILTSEEEGGVEPTYPYIRQLLQWDAESFLHSLDIAFEDSYLNDENQSISRLIIVRILVELVSSDTLSYEDVTFIYIFIARNVPKYPQFLQVAPSVLHRTLVHLATDSRAETREDRQLAAEYLLSAYIPHDSENLIKLFEGAKFYRILRSWHRQDRRWDLLFVTYIDDKDIYPSTAFEQMNEVLTTAKGTRGHLSSQLVTAVQSALPHLVHVGVCETALLLQKHIPELHDQALKALGEVADERHFTYLRSLVFPVHTELSNLPQASSSLPHNFCRMFLDLQCRYHPEDTVSILESLPPDFLPYDDIIHICEAKDVHDAVMWAHDSQGVPQVALDKAVEYQRNLSLEIMHALKESQEPYVEIKQSLASLQTIGKRGIDICLKQSRKTSSAQVSLEDMWFTLLNSQINTVQLISNQAISNPNLNEETMSNCLSELRSLVQNTFSTLVSITSTSTVSFPRLFKRLVDSTSSTVHSHYDEFRTILTGILESYRSDGDMLTMTKHLVERDLFETIADWNRQRSRGWTLESGICTRCRKPLSKPTSQNTEQPADVQTSNLQVVISRNGKAFHSQCYMD